MTRMRGEPDPSVMASIGRPSTDSPIAGPLRHHRLLRPQSLRPLAHPSSAGHRATVRARCGQQTTGACAGSWLLDRACCARRSGPCIGTTRGVSAAAPAPRPGRCSRPQALARTARLDNHRLHLGLGPPAELRSAPDRPGDPAPSIPASASCLARGVLVYPRVGQADPHHAPTRRGASPAPRPARTSRTRPTTLWSSTVTTGIRGAPGAPAPGPCPAGLGEPRVVHRDRVPLRPRLLDALSASIAGVPVRQHRDRGGACPSASTFQLRREDSAPCQARTAGTRRPSAGPRRYRAGTAPPRARPRTSA